MKLTLYTEGLSFIRSEVGLDQKAIIALQEKIPLKLQEGNHSFIGWQHYSTFAFSVLWRIIIFFC